MKKFWKKASAKAGFTLVELVVVIAVLAILAAVAYPAYTGYIQRANDAKVISQVSNIVTAVESAKAIDAETGSTSSITIKDGKVTIEGFEMTDKIGNAIQEFTNKTVTYTAVPEQDGEGTFATTISLAGTSYAEKGIQWTPNGGWDVATT